MTVRLWKLGSHAALSAVFDYTVDSRPQVEFMTWVQSESTRLNVAVRVPAASDQAAVQRELQPILDSVRIP